MPDRVPQKNKVAIDNSVVEASKKELETDNNLSVIPSVPQPLIMRGDVLTDEPVICDPRPSFRTMLLWFFIPFMGAIIGYPVARIVHSIIYDHPLIISGITIARHWLGLL